MGQGDKRYGIVFCGGGAKGAYQIGVWKYLNELGLSKEITGVSGASIGAINSLLFAQGDYEVAEEVWRQTRSSDIMAVDIKHLKMLPAALLGCRAAATAASAATGLPAALWGHRVAAVASAATSLPAALWGYRVATVASVATKLSVAGATTGLSAAATPLVGASLLIPLGLAGVLKRALPKMGLFSQERLRELIGAYAPSRGNSLAAGKEIYTVLTALKVHVPKGEETTTDSFHPVLQVLGEPEYRGWEGLAYEEIVETVLASAAIPGVYPAAQQEKTVYVDGGVVDNTPVKPLVDAGFQNIIVAHLECPKERERQKKERKVERQGKDGLRFIHIWPSDDIGGVLEITSELTQQRMELGYEDAKAQLAGHF